MRTSPIRIYDWICGDFTADARTEFLDTIGPFLTPLLQHGTKVLDLCCGAGAVSHYLAARGAEVTGLDLSPQMIDAATREAKKRSSTALFVLADILDFDFGERQYDLAVCLGNSLQDIPHQSFAGLRDRLWRALNENGRLVLDYFDGITALLSAKSTPEETTQQIPALIGRHFKRYDPSLCAFVEEYSNVATGELCEYKSYIYAGPVIDVVLAPQFVLESRIEIPDGRFFNVYQKRTCDLREGAPWPST